MWIFGGLQCVGHSFAYVAHFSFVENLGDVWIRNQRAAVTGRCATTLATHFLPGTGPASILWRIFSWSSQRNCSKWAKSPTAWNKKNRKMSHVRTEEGTYRRDEKRKTLYFSVVGSTFGLMRIRIRHFRSTRIRIQVFSCPTCKILQQHFFYISRATWRTPKLR